MTSFFQTLPTNDSDVARPSAPEQNLWKIALAMLAGLLVVGGATAVAVGLAMVWAYPGAVLGQNSAFDAGVAWAIVGGAAIFLGVVVGTAWLVLGAIGWDREH